ncbi:ankyrin repeat and SAM domain-containing protein 6 [Aplysia californica]|uniref:NAD(+) ADP-ribosyltransferase n=1 Tax=Aplysia californica TaxID=6500 RepID=A0ABM0JK16_APLCA|nr:ankyrin repeat and SAM domain-containing protein 6 [Aplysia californica]
MERSRQLYCACEQGDTDCVQALLEDGCEVDCVLDDEENTALQVAAANGSEQVVRLLIMRGAGLDKSNIFGWTPLLQAARYGHTNIVALLSQHQADLHAKTRYGASAMTLAAKGGHMQTVKLLIDSGVDVNGIGDGCEFSPLLLAAQHGHDAVLRVFLDRGCDVNFYTPSTGLTPLMTAALNGHMTTAQIIIERGGDPNVMNVCENTALEIATVRDKREVSGYLDRKTTNKPKTSPGDIKPDIIEAAKLGDFLRVCEILEQDTCQKDAHSPQDGATPLMFAAMTGRLDIAELLVMKGCDVNKQDLISGWTALMQATYHGKKNVAMFLLSIGADVNIQAKNGCTAFDMASLIDDVDTELLRQLAAKAMQVAKVEKSKKSRSKTNEVTAAVPSDMNVEVDSPKSGLKGWWNRMSNRFRNLKLGRTFTGGNRLTPLGLETSASVPDLTLKNCTSPQIQSARLERKTFQEPNQTSMSMTSYDTMLQETKQSASLYTLDIISPRSNVSSETLKPVIPPFLPSPSFALDNSDSSHRLTPKFRTYKSGEEAYRSSVMMRPIKVQSISSASSNPALGPPSSTNYNSSSSSSHNLASGNDNNSPSSSGGSSSITALQTKMAAHRKYAVLGKTRPNDSASGSSDLGQGPLFIPNPNIPTPRFSPFVPHHTPSRLFMPRKSATVPSAFRTMSNTTSPNSSTSGSSSITPQRSSRGRSTSSKGSTTSTLTPSPSPTPGKHGEDAPQTLDSLQERDGPDDELASIMKKLSLEKYNPIFEEQEVDMEAFLTLTDEDLRELGIAHPDSRRQILAAIYDLRAGKGRERQQFVDSMSTFNSTLKARATTEGSETTAMSQWSIQDEADPHVPMSKSRMS